jgi:hypothetical protein
MSNLTGHPDAVRGAPTLPDGLTVDHPVLGITDPATGVCTDLARVDGRYLSQETAASFTGRVIGPFAVASEPAFTEFGYLGR